MDKETYNQLDRIEAKTDELLSRTYLLLKKIAPQELQKAEQEAKK